MNTVKMMKITLNPRVYIEASRWGVMYKTSSGSSLAWVTTSDEFIHYIEKYLDYFQGQKETELSRSLALLFMAEIARDLNEEKEHDENYEFAMQSEYW